MRDALASPLLDAALRGAIVLVAALVLTTLLRRRPAAVRHAIWAGAIAAQLLMLGLGLWGPRWRVEAPEAVSALVPERTRGVDVVLTPDRTSLPIRVGRTPVAGADAPGASASTAASTPGRSAASEPATTAPATRRGPSLATVLVALWGLGAAVVLLRLAAGTVIVARLARRGTRVDDGGWLSLAQRLATTLRIDRPLILLRGDRLGVPVTWGVVYPVVLLPEDADAWPEERRRYVLVHEMAHVKRLDALTQLVGQVALALFWFDPLMWIAVRRMQLEREHACDDYVLRHGTQPSRYAEDLLEMVRAIGTPAHRAAQPAFAALAMARRSEFEGRMLSILDPVLDRQPLNRGRTLMSALASLLVIVPLAALHPYRPAPVLAQSDSPVPVSSSSNSSRTTDDGRRGSRADSPLTQPLQSLDSARRATGASSHAGDSAYARIVGRGGVATASSTGSSSHGSSSQSSTSNSSSTVADDDSCDRFSPGNASQTQFHMHADDSEAGSTIRYLDFDQRHCRQANIIGKIETSADESRVVALTPSTARAHFRERAGSVDREVTFAYASPGNPQSLTPVYRVNGVETPFDDEARRWFAELLPQVLAEAAVNVQPRVARWRAQGGTDGTLRHIGDLRSSGAKRAHYDALLENRLSRTELDRVVGQAGRDVASSGDLRAVLSKASAQTHDGQVSGSVLDSAIRAVASSGDRTAVLLAFGDTDNRSQLLTVMRIAQTIASSGDKSRLLIDLAPRYLGRSDAALQKEFFTTAATVPSSGDLARILTVAVPFAAKSNEVALATIQTAGGIASSGDRARVLVALAGSGAVRAPAVRDAYLRVTREIPSSSDARRALEAIASN